MTKKDYIKIAQVLKESKPDTMYYDRENDYQFARFEWKNICERMADMLADDNPLFNRVKFLKACGYND